jgi:hypothetical protein
VNPHDLAKLPELFRPSDPAPTSPCLLRSERSGVFGLHLNRKDDALSEFQILSIAVRVTVTSMRLGRWMIF